MDCSVLGISQGWNKVCNGIREKVISIVVQDYTDANFSPFPGAALDDINDKTNWNTRANAGRVTRFNFAADAAKEGGDAVTVENTSTGGTYHVRYNQISFTLYLESNECDYNEMIRVYKPGKLHKVFIETKSMLFGTQEIVSGVATVKGYTAELVVNPTSFQVEDNANGFELKVTFREVEEFDYTYPVAKPSNFAASLESSIPNGLTLAVKDISTIGSSILYVKNRCGAIKTGLDDDDFYLDGAVASGIPVVVTDNTDGTYTMDLTGIDKIQVIVGAPGSVTDISGVLDISSE